MMRMRFLRTSGAAIALLSVLATAHGSSAQSAGTATVTGHVIWCRAVAGPAASADPASAPDLADVTPGFGKGIAPPLRVAAQDVQLMVQGTPISTRTDATGSFTLTGVPAAQPLTLVAQPAAGPSLVLSGPSLTLNPGQTLDVGNLGLPDCTGNGSQAFTLQPAPTTDTPATDPADQLTGDESTPAPAP